MKENMILLLYINKANLIVREREETDRQTLFFFRINIRTKNKLLEQIHCNFNNKLKQVLNLNKFEFFIF